MTDEESLQVINQARRLLNIHAFKIVQCRIYKRTVIADMPEAENGIVENHGEKCDFTKIELIKSYMKWYSRMQSNLNVYFITGSLISLEMKLTE